MKKEYIILGFIIIALSAYIMTKKTDRDNYSLPGIHEINVADITEISIQKGEDKQDKSPNSAKDQNSKDDKIVILKKDGSWVVGAAPDKIYPADQDSITKILDIVKDLKLSALVSESGTLEPYELDSKKRITVTVNTNDKTVRKFEIGKTAPSFRHTFVRLEGNTSVYHAEKSFRNDFDKTVDDLRDKKVLFFDKSKINNLIIKKGDEIKDFNVKDGKFYEKTEEKIVDKTQDNEELVAKDGKISENDTSKSSSSTTDKSEKNENSKKNEALEEILTTLSSLKCHSFMNTENKDAFNRKGFEEIATISLTLEANKDIVFALYNKDENGNYPATSSETLYPFLLNTYEGNSIVENIDAAIGINKKDTKSISDQKEGAIE